MEEKQLTRGGEEGKWEEGAEGDAVFSSFWMCSGNKDGEKKDLKVNLKFWFAL